ncbi:MAG TPA: hypothetical protein VEI04_01035 [Syntrophobacteria bacterium]|nr:hypothetical protein [Syntrophobacteria bacterium]
MNRLSIKCLPFLLVGILVLPDISFAFHEKVRCQAFKDAIALCPKDLKAYLTENFEAVHEGLHFGDRNAQWRASIRPQDAATYYERLVKDLRDGKFTDYNTAHRFGMLAGFIAETISPGDYYSREDLIPQKVVYDGFQEVANVNASISGLVTKYRNPYQHNMNKKVNDYLYNATVNQIADYWTSAWRAGGNKTGLLVARGTKISHKAEVIYFAGGG